MKNLITLFLVLTTGCATLAAAPEQERELPEAEPVRRVVIDTVIEAPSILKKANELLDLAAESDKPINIIINSPGGAVYGGLQFVNAMLVAQSRGPWHPGKMGEGKGTTGGEVDWDDFEINPLTTHPSVPATGQHDCKSCHTKKAK